MSYRIDEKTTYETIVICDKCKKEKILHKGEYPLGFDNKMNGAIANGHTFKTVDGVFKNYCKECRNK